jgi:hypothetical protein
VVTQVAQRLGDGQLLAGLLGRGERGGERRPRRAPVAAQVVLDQPAVEHRRRRPPPIRGRRDQPRRPRRENVGYGSIAPLRTEPRRVVRAEQLGRIVVLQPEQFQVEIR